MDADTLVASTSLLASLIALVVAGRKRQGLTLTECAVRAVAYAEQMGGGPHGKLRQAIEAAQRLDAGDNGKRDYSDAQLRIAVEAELNRSQK